MKKFCVLVLAMLFACNAYATTDIASDATTGDCDETTLGTYSGSADLEIKWEPNTIPIRWYDNNTAIQNAQNTCNYDDILTVPTPPTRNGYNFTGWKVRPMMDFTPLAIGDNALTSGSERWGKGYVLSDGTDVCQHATDAGTANIVNCKTDSGFNALKQKEWKVQYNSRNTKGTLYGSAYCSARSGGSVDPWTAADAFATTTQLEEASGKKRHCWCQATGWQPENSDTIYANSSGLSWAGATVSPVYTWVFSSTRSSADNCSQACATRCSYDALRYSAFRRALFIGDGN